MAGAGTGRRLAALGLAWVAGVALHLQQPALWPPAAYVGLLAFGALAVGALALQVVARWRGRVIAAVVGAGLAGFGASGWQATGIAAETLPAALEGRDLTVTGVVASLPQLGPNGARFRFDVDPPARAQGADRLPARLSLGWYQGLHEDAAEAGPARAVRAGQRWQFTVRLRRPHGNLNPHGSDYELYLFERGLGATGYVRDAPPARWLADGAGAPVERLRQRLRDAVFAAVADPRTAGVLAALAVGDQSAIARDDWALFRNTGVAHLMAISGLHVTMFAWLAGVAVTALWRRSGRAMLWLAAPTAGRWGGLAAAVAYAVIAGWGVPAQRTVWMLATVTLLQAGGVRWPWPLVLLAAAGVVTAIDPWALLQPGFWLSFTAVGLLMVSAPATAPAADPPTLSPGTGPLPAAPRGWRTWPRRLGALFGGAVRTQTVATFGLTPLTLVFFQQVSLVGFVANLIAIPVVTLLVTPLAVAGVAVPWLWPVAAAVMTPLSAVLAALAAIPGAVWTAPVAPWWAQAAGLLGAVLVVLPLPWRARLLALPLVLALLVPPRVLPPPGGFDVVAADVGQGTAVLVRTRGHVLLFDTGAQYSRDSDAGLRVLLPLLRARGDERIDLLVLSHRDSDHVGGARALLDALSVRRIASSLEAGHPLLAGARPAGRCEAGQRWTWDGVEFAVLHPAAADYDRPLKPNAMSCVLRVEGGGRSLLLTGDIERAQEAALVAADPAALRADVLIAPHHGSRTSSSPAFIDAVAPRVVVVQAGYRNRFGHPAAEVVARYRERTVAVVTTASCGAWQWRHDGPPDGVCQRERARRYWHHGGGGHPP